MFSSFPPLVFLDWLPTWLALVLAYGVFTLVGFGSALVASGPLAQVMPVARVIPLLALLDFSGSALRGFRARRAVAWGPFARLFPGMLLGQLLGVLLLSRLPGRLMALALGGFVIWQGIQGLRRAAASPWSGRPAFWHGLLGGVLGGLFGSGGFVYAAYLQRHLESREAFRATQAVLIGLSTAWRLLLCLVWGLLDLALLQTALLCLPAMALGVFLGHQVDLRLGREQLFRLLHGLLVVSGSALIWRQFA
ncbi:TSUP family transporter [Azovibrio restrictus]|uniref:TSUP family transporter n=1 Tax=Azovibrio restrictus TaxID=146938 RepID=UPI00042A0BBE|nr:TSUP family transporter [Azovibrio restrictus]